MLFISACKDPIFGGPRCIDASDYGAYEIKRVNVPANQEFTYSGMNVGQNNPVQIDIEGTVGLCNNQAVYKPTAHDLELPNGDVITFSAISPDKKEWQPALANNQPFSVKKGDDLKIFVYGQFKDRNTIYTDGEGLYALIAPVGEDVNDVGDVNNPGHDYWYGQAFGDETNKLAGPNNTPTFFELYDNGSDVGSRGSGYAFKAPIDGVLYFKYARSASVRGIHAENGNNNDIRHSPWRGRYAWHGDLACVPCQEDVIYSFCAAAAAAAWFTFGAGKVLIMLPCIWGYELGCSSVGRLQEDYSAADRPSASKDGENCREHYASEGRGDHWIDDAYDGSEGDGNIGYNSNGLGYNITMEGGCEGRHGKFLEMHVSNTVTRNYEPVNIPPGCQIGTAPCEPLLDSLGEQVYDIVNTLNSAAPVSLDMRREVNEPATAIDPSHQPNPGYYSPGKYGERDPSKPATEFANGGELWFRIDDTLGTLFSNTSNYKDNSGSYSLAIKTLKVSNTSKAINNIIGYIRGVVYGYCRVSINNFDPNAPVLPTNPNTNEFVPINYNNIDYSLTEEQCDGIKYKLATDIDPDDPLTPAWQPGITKRMFTQLVGGTTWDENGVNRTNTFLNAVRASLVLFVAVYGFLYAFGLVLEKKEDVIKKVLKIAFILILFSPNSWEFLNGFFFTLFIDNMDELIQAISGQISGAAPVLNFDINGVLVGNQNVDTTNVAQNTISTTVIEHFTFVDKTITTFFSGAIWLKMLALFFSNNYGWLLFFMIFFHMIYYLYIVARAVIIYLISIMAISLLIIVSPIFIALMLFEKTNDFFDAWVRSLLSFLFQPVFVLFALGIFNLFIFNAFYRMMYFDVCWIARFGINIHSIVNYLLSPMYFYSPVTAPGSNVRLFDPIGFNQIILFFVFLYAASAFVEKMSKLSSYIFVGSTSTSADQAAKSTILGTASAGKSLAKGAAQSVTRGGVSAGRKAYNKVTSAAKKTPRG